MTGAGPPALSFNEIVALVTKAARGAGLGWGHAEDLGRAARWLAERSFGWDAALCRLLDAKDVAPRTGRLAAAADWVVHARPGEVRDFNDPRDAIWILPLASAAIFGMDRGLEVSGAGTTVRLSSDGSIDDGGGLFPAEPDGAVSIAITAGPPVQARAVRSRPELLNEDALARLSALADLTLVPASETSRTNGAGATRSDDD